MDREQLGRLVRQVWTAYCLETGDLKPSHVALWEEITEWDREVDRRIGEAVAGAVLRRERDAIAAELERGVRSRTLRSECLSNPRRKDEEATRAEALREAAALVRAREEQEAEGG